MYEMTRRSRTENRDSHYIYTYTLIYLAGVLLVYGRLRVTLHLLQLNICFVICITIMAADDISVPCTINSYIIFVITIVIVR